VYSNQDPALDAISGVTDQIAITDQITIADQTTDVAAH
jgi:hypothetical protein